MIGDLVRAGLISATVPTPAGKVTAVVPANRTFGDVIAGRGGRFNPPLVGVAFGGRERGGPREGGGLIHEAVVNMLVFIVIYEPAGVDAEQDELGDLADRVIDALAGAWPLARSRDGALVGGVETLLGDRWAYRGDNPVELSAEALGKNLRAWAVHFSCAVVFTPERADVAAQDEAFEGIDGTLDPRPGADPATPDEDLDEFEFGSST
jgi:hypothetical protein